MAKIALLIGVSDYGNRFSNLPGTQEDIRAMQRVLQNPRVGEFDSVELLCNPDRDEMEGAIETLLTENRDRENLVLLYFSGHGFRDDYNTLYFATRITEKNAQGQIRTSTAVRASVIHDYMSQSRSKRKVLILDCCFSGAFANYMGAKVKGEPEAVDVKAQLGGEGWGVLTSSIENQLSFEKEGDSIYTRYLVQGLETGAADRDNDGKITIDELHEYAKEKVQEAAPTMQPAIYAVREGYKILIARAPQGDPKLTYRKELEERAKQKRGRLSPIDKKALQFRWQDLGLSSTEAEQIANQVLQPFEAFWAKLRKFEQAVKETLKSDPQMGTNSLDDLKYLQHILKLRDEDIAPILNAHRIYELPGIDDLSSEKGIDYTQLRDLLKAQDWKAADKETYKVMIRAVGKKEHDWFTSLEFLSFPCTDLKTIDSLWVKYSKGNFGFSVQKHIYVECGAKLDGSYPGDKVWVKFVNRVGWGGSQVADDLWLGGRLWPGMFPYDNPCGDRGLFVIFSRTEACKI